MYITTPDGQQTTLRAVFSEMPPKTHHKEPEQSEVLAYIMQMLGSDMDKAIRAFNSMRNHDSKVLIYNRTHATWHGAEWIPSDEKEGNKVISRRITQAERKLEDCMASIRKMKRTIDNIEDALNKLIESTGQSNLDSDIKKLKTEVYNQGIDIMRIKLDKPVSEESKFADKEQSVNSFRNLYCITDDLSSRLDALESRLPASDAGTSSGSNPPN